IVQDMRLNTTFFQPTLAYQINDQISVGAGFVFGVGNFEYRNAMPLLDANGNEASRELTGRSTGAGFNLGLHIRPNDNIHIGFSYRSQVNMKIRRGYARFNSIPSSLINSYVNTAFESTIPMPQVLTAGIGWDISEWVTVQMEAAYTGWGAYDSLSFDYN